MKKEEIKISANEINRYTYCPYQWYYNKIYGQKTIKEKYKALAHKSGHASANFKKGIQFHEKYYKQYRLKRVLQLMTLLIGMVLCMILAGLAGGILQWH